MKGEPKRCSEKSEFGYEKTVESRIVPRFLAYAMEKMQLPQTEIGQGCQGKRFGVSEQFYFGYIIFEKADKKRCYSL